MKQQTNKPEVALYDRPGTIAYALKQNMNELYSINNVVELKKKLLEVIDTSDIKDEKAVETFKVIMQSKKTVRVLLDTVGTYMTGIKLK